MPLYPTIPQPPQSNLSCPLVDKIPKTIVSNLMLHPKPCIQAIPKTLENFVVHASENCLFPLKTLIP
jgi:hypothetical protein